MNHPEPASSEAHRSAVFVITHTVPPESHDLYEQWLSEILGAVSSAPGYLGREVFRPVRGKRTYTIIVRFDTEAHLQGWMTSTTRNAFIERVIHLLEKGDVHEVKTGIEFWFTPEGIQPPKRWKQFVLTVSAVYPLTLIIPRLLAPVLEHVPASIAPGLKGILMALSLTGLLTFVVMPHYTKLVHRWLYEDTE